MPDPDSWEARMSLRAAERNRIAAENRRYEGRPGHEGHHDHLAGTAVYCSCGHFGGITCVVFPDDWEMPTCSECGAEGAYLGP